MIGPTVYVWGRGLCSVISNMNIEAYSLLLVALFVTARNTRLRIRKKLELKTA